eukprot:350049-Alexandrium_andersonii.AAC.1
MLASSPTTRPRTSLLQLATAAVLLVLKFRQWIFWWQGPPAKTLRDLTGRLLLTQTARPLTATRCAPVLASMARS